jgi:phosphatidate cytidylyltransferase
VAAPEPSTVLRTRLFTAGVILPAVIALIIFSSAAVFNVFIAIMAAWGLYEIVGMTEQRPQQILLVLLTGAIPALVLLIRGKGPLLAPASVILALAAHTVRVGWRGAEPAGNVTIALGALGVGVLFPYIAFVRDSPGGVATVILMLLIVVASDSGAYFVGRSLGRRKLLPQVSPKKTIEGAIGGLIASAIVGLVLRPNLAPTVDERGIIVFALVAGALAQIGDLANSAYKRSAGVKDSGWIFPGHGGLLDRTCSLVFPAVFTYYYFY